jgi:hypothetical protein
MVLGVRGSCMSVAPAFPVEAFETAVFVGRFTASWTGRNLLTLVVYAQQSRQFKSGSPEARASRTPP